MMSSPSPGRLPAPSPRGRTDAGFTLIEVIVAMVVLAMIMTTAFGALRLGDRSWEAGMQRAGESEQLRTTVTLLRRQLNQILPMVWSVDNERRIAFNGDRTRVQFIAPAPQHHAYSLFLSISISSIPGILPSIFLGVSYIPRAPLYLGFRGSYIRI